jgi:hypothetical protein
MQHAYVPVFPLILLYKPGTEVSIKHSLKVTDAQGITRCRETKVLIVDSEAKKSFPSLPLPVLAHLRTNELDQWSNTPLQV